MNHTEVDLPLLGRTVHIFDRPYAATDFNITIVNCINRDQVLVEDEENFKPFIGDQRPGWKEILLVLEGTKTQLSNPAAFQLIAKSNFYLQAVKNKANIPPVTGVGMQMILVTSDDKLVFGIRGGSYDSNKAAIAPCGYIGEYGNGNPLFQGAFVELLEELAIRQEDMGLTRVIGYQHTNNFEDDVDFVLCGKTNKTFRELVSWHSKAIYFYNQAKQNGASELDARLAIKKAHMPNIDAWEHGKLIAIPNEREYLVGAIKSRSILYDGKQIELTDVSIGAIAAYCKFTKKNRQPCKDNVYKE